MEETKEIGDESPFIVNGYCNYMNKNINKFWFYDSSIRTALNTKLYVSVKLELRTQL